MPLGGVDLDQDQPVGWGGVAGHEVQGGQLTVPLPVIPGRRVTDAGDTCHRCAQGAGGELDSLVGELVDTVTVQVVTVEVAGDDLQDL